MGTSVAEFFGRLGLIPDERQWARGDALIGGMKKAIAGLVTYEALRGIGHMVESTIDLGHHLEELHQKTGLSASALQAYGYAAKTKGSDLDSFAHGVGKFARTLQEASDGSDQAERAIARVGLTSADVKAALSSGDGLDGTLLKIADKFKAMPDGAAKTALAMDLFGRSGAELIPTLNLGRDGLAKLKQEAQDLGVVMSDDAVQSTAELGENIDKLKMSVTGLKNQAIAALAPVIKDLVDRTLAWVKANKALIQSTIKRVVEGMASALKTFGKVVAGVIGFIEEHHDLVEHVITGLGALIAAFAVKAAADFTMAFGPLGAAVVAIGAVIAALEDLDAQLGTEHETQLEDASTMTPEQFKRAHPELDKDRFAIGSEYADFRAGIDQQNGVTPTVLPAGSPSVIVPGASSPGTPAAAAPGNAQINAPITINGAQDPKATAQAVKDHLSDVLSDAYQAMRGGKR